MSSFQLDLNGYYTYTSWSSLGDDGYSTFKLTVLANGVIYGSGSDKPGPFVLSGALINDDIRFIKLYTNSSTTWKYIGKRLPGAVGNVYQFAGAWGYVNSDRQDGQWAFTGIATGTTIPKHPTEGQWVGNYFYGSNTADNTHKMSLVTSLDPAVTYNAAGPFSIIGNGADDVGAFKIKGTVTSDGQWEVTKSYDTHSWKYQGRFDGNSTIAGIWRPTDGSTAGGSFTFYKQAKLDTLIAAKTMPTGGSFGITAPATLDSALKDAAASHNQGIASSNILALSKGFSS
ncbi:hypothetical protein CVT24_006633 [Panaeolus cyanescens]|uniref:Uncharacterized protein n=1 Tax=Panaeolus cyanescens TaxID=181874 RepID=A0A409YSD7_9AGAR|nr:hypothetical protein CVT24_006633 [Panaeolus cyanescens]